MPIISNSVQNNTNGTSASATPRSRSYRSGSSTLQLQEGQTLKGVVSDIHGNEITLSMEDGSSFTGKLPDANQYSIGQKAAFQITSLDNNTIYMKAISGAYLLDMEDTIEQALEEANLPKTPRNLDVVRSLLQNQQSISRESILSSIRLCAQFPEADVNAVITMKRLNIPLSDKNVRQFENYQDQSHQLLYKMDSLTDSINDMLSAIGKQVPRLAGEVGTHLLSLALEGKPSPEETALLNSVAEGQTSGETASAAADGTAASVQDAAQAAETVLDENGNPVPAAETILDENGNPVQNSENTPVDKNGNPLSTAEQASESVLAEEEIETILRGGEKETVGNAAERLAASPEETTGPFSRMKQLITNLAENTGIIKNSASAVVQEDNSPVFIHEQAGFILPAEARESFVGFLSDYPISETVKQGILDGSVTAREFLTEIQKAFGDMTEKQTGALLENKSFQAMVKAQFLSNWTLSPEQLKNADAMNDMYAKMSRQFETLSKFSENVLGKDVFTQLSGTASEMNENMDFMRTLNQTFQYIQLPLKLQNQNAHGDLYVMTRKESLKKDPNHLKVLLHLDMDNLGTLDIHISRNNSAVSTKFFVETEQTRQLLERNVEMLSDALNKQGYAFTSEMSLKEKDVDIVDDFLSAEAPVGDIKRYNFDLRA